ncbi:TetR family transcriptional regulator [Porticoccaceae bacterium]|nr:TetR family transcriptional regulator [Porticoccaceae bacterium]
MSERKQQILQAAIEIIVNQGYGNLTMRALARVIGIQLGGLQYHFSTGEICCEHWLLILVRHIEVSLS